MNARPVAIADTYSTDFETLLTVTAASGVLANDTDGDGNVLTATLVGNVSDGILALNADGSFTYSPAAGFDGVDSFRYVANDGVDDSVGVQVNLEVSGPEPVEPGAPVVSFIDPVDGAVIPLGSRVPVEVSATDPDGISNVRLSVDGEFIRQENFFPYEWGQSAADAVLENLPAGIHQLTVVALDDAGQSATETITITVFDETDPPVPDPNSAPIAIADSYQVISTEILVVDAANGLLANDSDSDAGDTLSAILDSNVSEGSLALNPNGSFSYTPVTGSSGVVTFSYHATDAQADSSVVNVTLNIQGVSGDTDLLVHLELDDFQDPSTALDSGILGNDGVITGATYVADSGDGSIRSLEFDNNDQVDLGSLDVGGTGLTVAAWINADSFPGGVRDPRIVSKASGGAANDHVFMLGTIRSGANTVLRARVRVGGDTTTLIADTGALSTDEWYHAALVYDGSTLKLYLNAQEVGSTALSGPVDQASGISVSVGAQPAGDKNFDGNIDDVRILQRAYSEAELQSLVDVDIIQTNGRPAANNDSYDVAANQSVNVSAAGGVLANDTDPDGDVLSAVLGAGVSNGVLNLNGNGSFSYTPNLGFVGNDNFTYSANDGTDSSNTQATVNLSVTGAVPVSDLLAHLEFEDFQTPITAADSSNNGNFGAVFGAEYVAQTGDGSAYSMEFTGDDTIDLSVIDVAGSGLTLASWINADTFPGNARDPRIISKAGGTAANDHVFMLSTIRRGAETVLRARIRVGGSTTTLIGDTGTSLSTNTWHHVAVTYDGSEIVLYLDGIDVGSRELSGSIDQDNSLSVAVGSQPSGSNGFDGRIDDVRILQRALSTAEINEIIDAAQGPGTGAPSNLIAQAISDTAVELSWTAVAGANEYRVFRDGVLIATVSDPNYTDTTVEEGVNYSYEVSAVTAGGVASDAAEIYSVNFASAQGAWWGTAWNYRSRVVIDSSGTARENNIATVPMNFNALIAQAGGVGAHDASRVRCVEVTTSGALVDETIRCQSGDGELVLLLSGTTSASATRYFHVYYDTAIGGEDDLRSPLVTLTENVIDEGFNSLEIETNTGNLNYHTGGAGFSSLVDANGIDWIDYNSAAGGRGEFRGIPNLLPPADGGFFHPGPATASTTVVDSGPLRVRIESVTNNGAWRVRWDVYPEILEFNVLEKPAVDYWFLYEGTPGGVLDNGDSTVRSTGTASTLNALDSWGGDIPGEEWVMVTASEVPRSLFIAKQNGDTAFDSYRPFSSTEGLMTVFGFGRDVLDAQLTNTGDTFFLGFLDTQDFTTARASIRSAVRELVIGTADAAVRP